MCSERKKGARNVYLHHFPMHRTWYLPLILESIPFIVLKTSNNVQLAFSFLLFCLMSTLNLQEFEKEHQSFWVWLRLKLAKKARTCENIQTSEGRERNRKKKVNLLSACQRMGQEDHWSLRPYYQPQQHKKTLLGGEGGARALGTQTSWWRACLYL